MIDFIWNLAIYYIISLLEIVFWRFVYTGIIFVNVVSHVIFNYLYLYHK